MRHDQTMQCIDDLLKLKNKTQLLLEANRYFLSLTRYSPLSMDKVIFNHCDHQIATFDQNRS